MTRLRLFPIAISAGFRAVTDIASQNQHVGTDVQNRRVMAKLAVKIASNLEFQPLAHDSVPAPLIESSRSRVVSPAGYRPSTTSRARARRSDSGTGR